MLTRAPRNPSVTRYYLVPSSSSAAAGESEALEVLAHILGRGSNSRLYRSLVFGQAIAVNAGASYDGTALDATRLSVYVTPKPGISLTQAEQALDAVLAEVTDKGITDDELERSKSRMIADAIYANDNQRALAQWYGAALATGANGRRGAHLARSHSRSERRSGARGRAALARQAPLGHGLSGQGRAFRGETLVNVLCFCRRAASAITALLAGAVLIVAAPAARAMTIERVVSPSGIEAWLVRNSAPMLALEFAFLGSADQDPADKPGVANLAASLFDEGAGPLDAMTFHDRLERAAIEMSFRAGRDHLRGTLRTLEENRDEAFDYLRLALTEPRFDAEAVERMRVQTISGLRRQSGEPQRHCQPELVGNRLSRASLWAPRRRHARIVAAHHRR